MLGKKEIQFIHSLRIKKYRQSSQCFFAEGIKVIKDLLKSDLKLERLYTSLDEFSNHQKCTILSISEMKNISSQTSPSGILGVFRMQEMVSPPKDALILALDNINDPGNLGTIIRLCDWFDIRYLVCNNQTVDAYNPKVIQASMGSIAKVSILYTNLNDFICQSYLPKYAMAVEGSSLENFQMPKYGIIIMGNEANGISQEILDKTDKITISRYNNSQTPDSLNVAMATAIVLNHIKSKVNSDLNLF